MKVALEPLFVAALFAWFGVLLFSPFVNDGLGFLAFIAVGLLVLATGLAALMVRGSTRGPGRLPRAFAIFAGLVLAVVLVGPCQRVGTALFWRSHAGRFTQLTTALLEDGRIRNLSVGQGPYATLNGSQVSAATTRHIDTAHALPSTVWSLTQVLARDGVDRSRFEQYRHELQQLGMREVQVGPDYVAYLRGGMLDNLDGYLWVRPGHAPPALDTEVFSAQLVMLSRVSGRWYHFVTT